VALDKACRQQQVNEGWFATVAEVPTHAISMSINHIMLSKHIICTVPPTQGRRGKAMFTAACFQFFSCKYFAKAFAMRYLSRQRFCLVTVADILLVTSFSACGIAGCVTHLYC
jgi:hypothetical protein